jgi:hypothetical protein
MGGAGFAKADEGAIQTARAQIYLESRFPVARATLFCVGAM